MLNAMKNNIYMLGYCVLQLYDHVNLKYLLLCFRKTTDTGKKTPAPGTNI